LRSERSGQGPYQSDQGSGSKEEEGDGVILEDTKQKQSLKLKLRFRDRVGIVADISERIAKARLNIAGMEVERAKQEALVYLDIEDALKFSGSERLMSILEGIPDLLKIRQIETLPSEERENRFKVVLDNISDGVISIDKNGRVTTINKIACKSLGREEREILGRPVLELGLPDNVIIEGLGGKQLSNIKQNLITKQGRFQYFSAVRPIWDSERQIIGAVEIAKDMQEIRELARAISEPGKMSFSDIVGRTPLINEAIAFAQKIAATDTVVSIRGESGTGKELFAGAIHSASGRPGPFVPINCAALPEHLLEAELFGYEGGSFTGGKQRGKPGLFEIAGQGTVFLDEIAEMNMGSQAKILRTIQESVVRRIGGSEEIPVHCRVITASNRNLKKMVDDRTFRQDLYYRINVLPIHIPPLRERIDDIPFLVEHFLMELAAGLGKEVKSLTQEAMEKLFSHGWPGNVRELKNVVERAAIISDKKIVDHSCILFSHELEAGFGLAKRRAPREGKGNSLKEQVGSYEKSLITNALKTFGSIRGTAKALKISHTALLKKVRKYEIQR
jgi:transcriptional regulator of aroF, aroG, tyrA and aromatic amino acid transport